MRGCPAPAEGLLVRCLSALALFVLVLAGQPMTAAAQTVTPNPAWSLAASTEDAGAIGTDSSGNLYVYGQFSGPSTTIGSFTLTRAGGTANLWVAKVSPGGSVVWAKNFGSATNGQFTSYGMAVDPSGNVYIAGSFGIASVTIGTTTLSLSTGAMRDGVVAKLTSDGSIAWAVSLPGGNTGGSGDIKIYSVALDAANNPVISGSFGGATSTVIGGTTLTRSGSSDLIIAKLSATSGGVTWITNFGGTGTVTLFPNVGVDPNGNVYAYGAFGGTSIIFGSTTLTRTGSGGSNLFLAKLNATGTPVWAKGFGATTNLSLVNTPLNGMDVDRDGNSYFIASLSGGNLDVGGTILTKNSTSSTDMVIAKIDTAGNTVWARNYGTTGAASTNGLGVRVDGSGNVYAGGYFNGATIAIGGTTLSRIGTQDGLVIRLNGSGAVTWAQNYGGAGATLTLRPVALSGTNVVATGIFSGGQVSFGSLPQLDNLSTTRVFVAAIGQTTVDPTPTPTPTPTPSPTPTPAPPPSFVSTTTPPPAVLNANTTGSGQGTVSLAASFSNPGSLTFSAAQSSGAPLPGWLTFDPSTVSFAYTVPLPPDLPIQPAADGAADAAVRAGRSVVNTVYPLAVLVQTVPVALTASGGGQSYTATVNMDFYAPRAPVAISAVSYSAGGISGNAASRLPALSWDGGQVVFETGATNINAAASSDYTSIARYQGLSGRRDLLSQTAIPGGGVANAANGNSNNPAVSAAGNYAVFSSAAPGVSLTPNNRLRQIYRTSLVYPRVSLNEAATPAAVMMSTTAAGLAADAPADLPAISEQGTFVAFESAAANLGPNPDRLSQIWRKDATTGAVVLVSSTAAGAAGNGDSRNVSLSWDGSVAVFDSTATNLVAGGTAGRHVYLKNLTTGQVYRLSAAAGAGNARIDARATSVVYVSSSGTKAQVLRYDIASGTTSVVSATPAGLAGNGDSTQPTVSADGRFVAFRSTATDLVAGYADNGYPQVWVRDVMRGVTALVTQTAAGAPGRGASSDPALSGDGGSIGFASQAGDLVNGNPLPGQIHLAANPLVLPGRTAYWSTTEGGNLAWSVERWGDRALVAGLAYTAGGGTAVWAAGECRFTGLTCQGTLSQWNQSGAASSPVAPVTLAFTADGRQAAMTVGNGAARTLVPYPVGGTRTTGYAGLPQNGYWWVPGSAAGVNSLFIDTDTQVAATGAAQQKSHVTLFGYDAAGNARWYAAEGTVEADQTFSGQLYLYSGGSSWTSAGSGGQPAATLVGTIRLNFTATDRATVQLPDGRSVTASRWRF
jgi:hypothetical protein